MRQRTGTLFSILLLLALMLSGCAAPAVGASFIPAADAVRPYGVDSAAPHASAVLQVSCSKDDCLLRAFVPETGADAPGAPPLPLGQHSPFSISPDGRTLAYYHYTDPHLPRGHLALVDLQAWTIHETGIRVQDWGVQIAFSPDGSRLVLSSHERVENPSRYHLVLVDAERRALILEAPLHFAPGKVTFSADGEHVLVYGWTERAGTNGIERETHVARLTAQDLRVEWTAALPDVQDGMLPPTEEGQLMGRWLQPGTAFDRAAGKLYVVHADADKLTTVDVVNERVQTVEIAPAQTWIERGIEQLLTWLASPVYAKAMESAVKQAVLSADGTRLFVTGQVSHAAESIWEAPGHVFAPLGLQVVDVATGAEVARLADAPLGQIRLSPQGDRLFLVANGPDATGEHSRYWTLVYDTTTPEQVGYFLDYGVWPAQRLDGRPLLTGSGPDQHQATAHVILDESGERMIFEQTDPTNAWMYWLQFE